MIGAFRKLGIPENAFGFEGSAESRLDSEALENLAVGRIWRGVDNLGVSFVQQVSEDGRIAFRDNTSLMAGTAWIDKDMFCVRFSSNMGGRDDCGHIYHNPNGSSDEQNEYVRVALGNIYYFSAD